MAGFPGVQNYLNNAIGQENWLQQGGVNVPIQQYMGNVWQGLGQQNTGLGTATAAQNAGLLAPGGQNPFLAAEFNAAAQPVTQTYQNVTAPNIVGNAASAGGVGGSGQRNAFNAANTTLGDTLANLAAGIYGPAYQQSQALANQNFLQGQGLGNQNFQQALGLGGNLFGQGLGITTNAAGMAPSLASAAYIPSQQLWQSGQQGQNQLQNILNTAYQNLYGQSQWPYQALNMLGQGVGQVGSLGGGTNVNVQTGSSGWF